MNPASDPPGAFAMQTLSRQDAAPARAQAQPPGMNLPAIALDDQLALLLGEAVDLARFAQACQLMTGLARPLSSVWNRLADPAAGQGHSALAAVVRSLATRSDTDQWELRQHLQTLHSWARAHHQQERWRLTRAADARPSLPRRKQVTDTGSTDAVLVAGAAGAGA